MKQQQRIRQWSPLFVWRCYAPKMKVSRCVRDVCMFLMMLPLVTNAQADSLAKLDAFDFSTTVQGGFFNNHVGGIKTGGDYMGRVHITMGLDTEKAGLWKNGRFFVNAVASQGGNPTATYIGDYQPISRNEAAPEIMGLFEFWYQHDVGKFRIIVGQHDMNALIGINRYAGQSIHSAFGMNPSLTPNAGNSFSIFPRTMPAIILQLRSLEIGRHLLNVRSGVYAGFSKSFDDDPYNIEWELNEGYHLRLEVELTDNHPSAPKYSVKLGWMYHSGLFPNVVDQRHEVQGNLGYYIIADWLAFSENDMDNQGLGLFLQVGSAPGDQNFVTLFSSFGFVYTGLIPKRPKDQLFLGFMNSTFHNELVDAGFEVNRLVIELNYAMHLGKHFTIQPDVQYIINPGNRADLDNALLTVLRFSIAF